MKKKGRSKLIAGNIDIKTQIIIIVKKLHNDKFVLSRRYNNYKHICI